MAHRRARPLDRRLGGEASVEEEVETVSFEFEVDMTADEYDEDALIAELALLYGVNASLISLEATPIDEASALAPPSPPRTAGRHHGRSPSYNQRRFHQTGRSP